MLLRILEDSLGLIVLGLTIKEVLVPLYLNKPLFPLLRRTVHEETAQAKKDKRP